MLRSSIALLSVAYAAEETPKVQKYDECVGAPAKAQQALYLAQPECTKASTYCSTCLPSLLDILDDQEDCCEELKGTPDIGMRAHAYEMCKAAIPKFKAEQATGCDNKTLPSTSVDRKYSTCRKDVINAQTGVYMAHPDCANSNGTFCEKCFAALAGVGDINKGCCTSLEAEPQQHAECIAAANAEYGAVLARCPQQAAPTGSVAQVVDAATKCHDISAEDAQGDFAECHKNVLWAKQHGITGHPEFYTQYSYLTPESSLVEIQHALYMMKGDSSGQSWDCPIPCSVNPAASKFLKDTEESLSSMQNQLFEGAEQQVASTVPAYSTPANVQAPQKKSWGVWVWLLILMGVCCCVPLAGLCCSAFLCYESVSWIFGGDDKPEKAKKRNLVFKSESRQEPENPQAEVEGHAQGLPTVGNTHQYAAVATNTIPMPMLQPMFSYQVPAQQGQYAQHLVTQPVAIAPVVASSVVHPQYTIV
eukprot:TRINITY_DN47027_c0_g1_i1.p1 TRINITY_DN47027_c0_g1~~TRINITY_DN47027_c0_g1_i1.p1  ORF type:complete len:476 (+),score=69.09 TRINITY_DN47027_c0_g1_i1:73-1500(+)